MARGAGNELPSRTNKGTALRGRREVKRLNRNKTSKSKGSFPLLLQPGQQHIVGEPKQGVPKSTAVHDMSRGNMDLGNGYTRSIGARSASNDRKESARGKREISTAYAIG